MKACHWPPARPARPHVATTDTALWWPPAMTTSSCPDAARTSATYRPRACRCVVCVLCVRAAALLHGGSGRQLHAKSQGTLNADSRLAEPGVQSQERPYVIAHGVLMSVAWGLLLPLGACFPMFRCVGVPCACGRAGSVW